MNGDPELTDQEKLDRAQSGYFTPRSPTKTLHRPPRKTWSGHSESHSGTTSRFSRK